MDEIGGHYSSLGFFSTYWLYIVYARPTVRHPTTVPCAATRSCIRKTLVLMVPRCLYLYAPIKPAATKPAKPVKNIYVML